MNVLLDLAHAHSDYLAVTAGAGATGHMTLSSARALRRRVLHPLQALRRAARGLLFYALGFGALWVALSYVVQTHPAV